MQGLKSKSGGLRSFDGGKRGGGVLEQNTPIGDRLDEKSGLGVVEGYTAIGGTQVGRVLTVDGYTAIGVVEISLSVNGGAKVVVGVPQTGLDVVAGRQSCEGVGWGR